MEKFLSLELSASLPVPYAEFLRLANGYSYNGVTFFTIATDGALPELIRENSLLRIQHPVLADYLVLKNVPFREAHGIVGRAVAFGIAQGRELDQLSLAELREFSPVIEEDVYAVLSVEGSVNSRVSEGGTGIVRVREAVAQAEQLMGIGK